MAFGIARVSDGVNYPDSYFAGNWSGMKANGVVRGVYQFFRASEDPVAQADYLVQQVGSIGPGDLPPFADVETLDNVSIAQNVSNLQSWWNEVQTKLGITPAIYTSKRVWALLNNPTSGFSAMDLWVANWGVSSPALPPEWRDWTFWQYTDSGTVNGITGSPGVDLSYFHGSVTDLQVYSGMAAPSGFFRGLAADSTGQGYWTCGYDGGVFAYGDATFRGTGGGQSYSQPILGIVRTPTGYGYWLFGADGNVLPFGDAVAAGNLAGQALTAPIVGMASTHTGQGYWLAGQDGTITPFGDAQNYGQPSPPSSAVVGLASTPTGLGYWVVCADGNVYVYGDAINEGSLAGQPLTSPVVGLAATPTGKGYWLACADGTASNYGDAPSLTYTGSLTLNAPVVGITATLTGKGFWLVSTDGTVFTLGDAVNGGARPR
jgi:hypothetical protein